MWHPDPRDGRPIMRCLWPELVDIQTLQSWVLQRMGLDVDSIVLCQPDNGELALEDVNQLSLSIT